MGQFDIAQGLPQFATVGLPEGAVKESKDRVKSAIKKSGYEFPPRRITINIAPVDIRKEGTAFDLPMAIELLTPTGLVPAERAGRFLFMGELSRRPHRARTWWPAGGRRRATLGS